MPDFLIKLLTIILIIYFSVLAGIGNKKKNQRVRVLWVGFVSATFFGLVLVLFITGFPFVLRTILAFVIGISWVVGNKIFWWSQDKWVNPHSRRE